VTLPIEWLKHRLAMAGSTPSTSTRPLPGWAKIYLDKAGMVASVRLGVHRVTYIDLPA
jgi:hypothetical protein